MPDYFDEVETEVREARRRDPDVVLPWSWWQKQADRHGMSPNAIYTRAVKAGLYTPPAKRESNTTESRSEASAEPVIDGPSPVIAASIATTDRTDSRIGSRPVSRGEAMETKERNRPIDVESRIRELTAALEEARRENRRLRRALRRIDGLTGDIRVSILSSILGDDDTDSPFDSPGDPREE